MPIRTATPQGIVLSPSSSSTNPIQIGGVNSFTASEAGYAGSFSFSIPRAPFCTSAFCGTPGGPSITSNSMSFVFIVDIGQVDCLQIKVSDTLGHSIIEYFSSQPSAACTITYGP